MPYRRCGSVQLPGQPQPSDVKPQDELHLHCSGWQLQLSAHSVRLLVSARDGGTAYLLEQLQLAFPQCMFTGSSVVLKGVQ